ECKKFTEDQIEIHIGAQQDTAFLQGVIDQVGIPDIVVDDGSHVMSHLAASFDFLYPKMLKNGVYLVEDLHTAYWEEYEGGLLDRVQPLRMDPRSNDSERVASEHLTG